MHFSICAYSPWLLYLPVDYLQLSGSVQDISVLTSAADPVHFLIENRSIYSSAHDIFFIFFISAADPVHFSTENRIIYRSVQDIFFIVFYQCSY